jgi:hypothetical protein
MWRAVSRRRPLVAVAAAIVALAVVSGVAYAVLDARRTPDVDCGSFRFDSALWKKWQSDPSTLGFGPRAPEGERFSPKQRAGYGVAKCGVLEGKTRRQVRALLSIPQGAHVEDDSLSYILGPARGLLGRNPHVDEYLVVWFGRGDRVAKVTLHTIRK